MGLSLGRTTRVLAIAIAVVLAGALTATWFRTTDRTSGKATAATAVARTTPPTPTTHVTPPPAGATPPAVPEAAGQTGIAVPVAEDDSSATSRPFPTVPTHRASVTVTVDPAQEQAVRDLLAADPDVVHLAAVTVTATTLGGVPADVAEVDPEEFRAFTPEATANHRPLWDRLAAGDLAVTHEFGTVHEVPLGSRLASGVDLPTGEPLSFRVGAFATNGTPPVADAMVVEGALGQAGGQGTRVVLVALDPRASPEATAAALQEEGFAAEEIPDPRLPDDQTVVPVGQITPENVWDHLAMCESSGDWQINTGNGYYGGLQFLPESWAAVGGQDLPHQHTREEQIYRATLLWQIQGWEAWPQCARKLGLIVDPPPEPTPRPTGVVTTESPE